MPIPPDWSQRLSEFVGKWDSNKPEYQGTNSFDKFVVTERATSWDQFVGWLNELQGPWCFRGQREAEWSLQSSLDRRRKKDWASDDPTTGFKGSGYYHLDRGPLERELLFRFQQQAHRYVANPPPDDDLSSWLALMQHHGVPTRFLDWTKSPYVAMYFALEEKPQEKCAAVWAVDLDWLEKKGHELLGSEAGTLASHDSGNRAEAVNRLLLSGCKNPRIVRVSPARIDERMAAQQGLFLCPVAAQGISDAVFFTTALMSMMVHLGIPDQPIVRKLEVGSDLRIEFLKKLRDMNIHRSLLFPGLDGFGQSLRLDLEIKVETEP